MKYLKWFLLTLIVIVIILLLLIFSNEEVEIAKKLDEKFLIDRIVFKSNLDIYDKNSVTFNEKQVNGLLSERLVERLNSNLGKDQKIKNIYLNLDNQKIIARASFENYSFIITMDLNINLDGRKLKFKAKNFKIGNLPLPKFILNNLGLKDINSSLYLDTRELKEIDILDINLSQEDMEISYRTNNDKIIEKYVPNNQRDFIESMEELLKENKNSKELANNIIRIALLYGTDRNIPESLIDDLENNFIKLNNKTKANLIFTILKYNIDYFADILIK